MGRVSAGTNMSMVTEALSWNQEYIVWSAWCEMSGCSSPTSSPAAPQFLSPASLRRLEHLLAVCRLRRAPEQKALQRAVLAAEAQFVSVGTHSIARSLFTMAASSRRANLSVIQSVRDYVTKMASDVSGMKVLVMDAETTGIVSMVYTQTQILQHEVFLIDSIERARTDKMAHLKAIYFVRPTLENVRLLAEEFKEPKYGEYHIFFSNLTRDPL